jgi:tRNA (cytidine/uridine-2'-O-)-methyltransferase
MTIVLVGPEIPGNTGSIGRTCVALSARLVLIKPIAFDISEKAVRRAGLDYWKHVQLTVCEDWNDFLQQLQPDLNQLFFTSRFAEKTIYQADLTQNPFLIFGSETKGLPSDLQEQYKSQLYSLPTFSDQIRSLNLANAATTIAFEAVRQQSSR